MDGLMRWKYYRLCLLTILALCGTTSITYGLEESNDVGKERADSDLQAPPFISINGIRYEAIQWGKALGLKQNGGYIAAIDEKTGKRKWLKKVYSIHYSKDMEEDKQDIFISRLTEGKTKGTLLIENDEGKCYILDLKSLIVKEQNR